MLPTEEMTSLAKRVFPCVLKNFYSAIYLVDYLAKSMQKKYPIALSPAKTLSGT